jgi:hypothetical protein
MNEKGFYIHRHLREGEYQIRFTVYNVEVRGLKNEAEIF